MFCFSFTDIKENTDDLMDKNLKGICFFWGNIINTGSSDNTLKICVEFNNILECSRKWSLVSADLYVVCILYKDMSSTMDLVEGKNDGILPSKNATPGELCGPTEARR